MNVMPANFIDKSTISSVNGFIGTGLMRPECALAHKSGIVLVPNWSQHGGISIINQQNQSFSILSSSAEKLRPNGIALESGGSVLLAHLGEETGGIFRLYPDGATESLVKTVEGKPMPPANFVVMDSLGRLWITVSTRKTPRASDYRHNANSGFLAVALPGASDASIVADNLGYANECVIDEANNCVYVNETFGRRLSVFQMHDSPMPTLPTLPTLTKKQTVCEFGKGTYPDGLALDSTGCLWITSIVSNRIIKVHTDGNQELVFEDCNNEHVNWAEDAYKNDSLGRQHLDTAKSRQMKNISNVAFGGVDLRTLYIGNLLGNSLPFLEVDVAGAPMIHWDVTLGDLERYV